jgi:hypothetical protein
MGMHQGSVTISRPNKGDEVDRAGITAFREMTFVPPARQPILGVRVRHEAVAVTVMLSAE